VYSPLAPLPRGKFPSFGLFPETGLHSYLSVSSPASPWGGSEPRPAGSRFFLPFFSFFRVAHPVPFLCIWEPGVVVPLHPAVLFLGQVPPQLSGGFYIQRPLRSWSAAVTLLGRVLPPEATVSSHLPPLPSMIIPSGFCFLLVVLFF